MKKTILFVLVFVLAMSFVLAVGSQGGNAGQGSQLIGLEAKEKAHAGDYVSENGEALKIREENGIKFKTGNVEAESLLNMTQESVQNKTRLHVQLSNGRNAEIKIMPSTASETALARLRLKVCNESRNCTIQLKEVGSGNESRAAYEIKSQKESKILGLFKKKMQVEAQVDAETGEVIKAKKPWWAFLATESEE